MRVQIKEYQELKQATIAIQRRFRRNGVAKLELNNYQKMKKVVILIQRKWRATLTMRVQIKEYQELTQAVVTVQRRFRMKVITKMEFNKYQRLKEVTILIQRKWRATLATRVQEVKYQTMKTATITIQRRFREYAIAKSEFEKYQKLKRTVIFVQSVWRAKLAMKSEIKNYQALKNATIVIQNRYRAKLTGRIERDNFEKLRRAVIFIQQKWRAKLAMRTEMRKYQNLKNATIKIQMRFRTNVAAKMEYDNYQKLKKTVIFVQRKWRAKLAMRIELKYFQDLKKAAITVQKYFVKKLALKQELQRKQERKIITQIQNYARGFLVRRRHAYYFTDEAKSERKRIRLENAAAAKIQAAWRGYKLRSSQTPQLLQIYERLKIANENATPENTLGSRCENIIMKLSGENVSLKQMIEYLEKLDNITRRCKQSCLKFGTQLPTILYETLIITNRSYAEMKLCTAAASILINLYRFKATRPQTWIPEYIEKAITMMKHFCDKEDAAFPTLCTLIWFFAHDEEYKNVILASPKCNEKISSIKELCIRKARMISKQDVKYKSYFTTYKKLPLPCDEPDWGFDFEDKPKTFVNSVQAIECLWSILGF